MKKKKTVGKLLKLILFQVVLIQQADIAGLCLTSFFTSVLSDSSCPHYSQTIAFQSCYVTVKVLKHLCSNEVCYSDLFRVGLVRGTCSLGRVLGMDSKNL